MTLARTAAVLALLTTVFAAPASAQEALGQVIREIRVEGNEKVETEAIIDNIAIGVGDIVRTEAVQRAIRDIFRLRYFKDVRVEAEEAQGGGVVLVIRVKEKPAVREVVVEGNKKVTTDDIKEVLTIKPFSILDEAKVAATQRKIEELYEEKGFFLAEIDTKLEGGSGNETTVRFVIREGRKTLVKQIDVVGNEALKDGYIKARLQTKGAGIFPGAGQAGTYRRETLETDGEIIAYLYSAFGYVDVEVSQPEVFLTPDKRWVYVTFHVVEGEQYRVGTVEVKGDPLETRDTGEPVSFDDLKALLKTEPGEVYNRVEVAEDVQRLVDRYSAEGYAFANVIPIPRQDRDRRIVDLVFDTQKGNVIQLEDIVITGNLSTWDKTIRREISLMEGDTFRGTEIERTRRRLERLGYFEDIKITTPRGDGKDTLDLAIDVTEKPTGTFSLGAGFSSVESFVFTANISRANFLGLGYTMALNANLSLGKNLQERGFFQGENSQQQISLDLIDPYFLDTRWTGSISVFSINRTYLLSEYARGINIAFGHYLDKGHDDIELALRYGVETVGLTSLRPAQKQAYGGQLYRSGTKSGITVSLVVDKRDNRITPTKGWYFTTSAEMAGGFRIGEDRVLSLLGGDFRFLRTQVNLRGYYPLGTPEVVLRGNFSFGWIHSLDGTLVPFTERYRSGGINSIRGFTPLSLGPQIRYLVNSDPNHAARSSAIGGTLSLVTNIEIEFPIIPPAQVRGVAFFDMGNAFGGLYGNEAMHAEDIRFSAGFGIRWRSPMGPLRFEWGFPIGRKPGERAQVFEFTIGSFF